MNKYTLDPRTKIIFYFTIYTLTFISKELILIFILTAFILGIGVINKSTRKKLVSTSLKIIPMLLFAFILWTLFYKWSLIYSFKAYDGMMFSIGIFMTTRLFLILLTSLLFVSTITPIEMMIALENFGLPYPAVFTLGLAIRHLSTFSDEYLAIKEAQASRGLELDKGFLMRRIKNYTYVVTPLLIRGIEDAEKLSLAMRLKLFSFKNHKRLRISKLKSNDIIIIVICILTIITYILLFKIILI